MPDQTLGAVTVMSRVKGYNPDAGDWFWANDKTDSFIEKSRPGQGVYWLPHRATGSDWIFTGPVQ